MIGSDAAFLRDLPYCSVDEFAQSKSMLRLIRLALMIVREEGLLAVARRFAFRYTRIHPFTVFRLDLRDPISVGNAPIGIDLHEATLAEVRQLRQGRTDLPEYFFRDETERLDRCWVGLAEGRLGFIAWVSMRGSTGMVRVGPTDAELAYIYCLDELRGRRLTAHAVSVIAAALRAEGATALLAVPHSRNPAIVRSFERCGFTQLARIRRFGGLITWPRTPLDLSRQTGVQPPSSRT